MLEKPRRVLTKKVHSTVDTNKKGGRHTKYQQKKWEFNGTSTHLLDGYINANQRLFSTFLSKITKYNRVPLAFHPSVARLLGHDPTPQTNLSGHKIQTIVSDNF